MKKFYLALYFTLAISGLANAANVDLNWDPVESDLLAGYRVYYTTVSPDGPFNGYGADQGDSPITIDKAITQVTLTGLSDNLPYYFAVTAFTDKGQESGYSQPVSNFWMPVLTYPSEGAQNVERDVQLEWTEPTTDPGKYTYTLYLGTSPSDMVAIAPPLNSSPIVPSWFIILLAGLLSGGLFLIHTFVRVAGQRLAPFAKIVLTGCLLTLVTSCGGGGSDGGTNGSSMPSADNLLDRNTTYFWKIVADDGEVVTESTTGSFTTGE